MPKIQKTRDDFFYENKSTIDYLYGDLIINLNNMKIKKYINIDYESFVDFVYENSYKY